MNEEDKVIQVPYHDSIQEYMDTMEASIDEEQYAVIEILVKKLTSLGYTFIGGGDL